MQSIPLCNRLNIYDVQKKKKKKKLYEQIKVPVAIFEYF